MEKDRIILGLDVSTTTIGISLMSYKNGDEIPKIIKLTHISPKVGKGIKGIESLCLKKNVFEQEFLMQYKDFKITDVVIEEPLLRSNNIFTVGTLLRFNGMISDSVYQILNVVPTYISSYDSRKYAFPELMAVRKFNKKGEPYSESKIKRNKPVLFGEYPWDIDKKQIVLDKVSELYPDIEWMYNRNGNLKKENFDSADSICCVLGLLGMEKEDTKKNKK